MYTHAGYKDLSSTVRDAALAELAAHEQEGLYYSPRLEESRRAEYVRELRRALSDDTDHDSLSRGLRPCIAPSYRDKNNVSRTSPSNSADLIAQMEFKRYYVAGVCLTALARGESNVAYYRAFPTTNHRLTSDLLVGTSVDAEEILMRLRTDVGPGADPRPPLEFGSGLCVGLIAT